MRTQAQRSNQTEHKGRVPWTMWEFWVDAATEGRDWTVFIMVVP